MISIIIPVYNCEKYLKTCIESILAQEYKEWEIILVDDGSTDGSPNICDDYSKTDKRISVFHTDNYGTSHARNIGIENVKGDNFLFIDADDYISPTYFNKFITHSYADLVVGGYQTFGVIRNGLSQIEENIELKDNWNILDVKINNPRINAIYHICGKLYKTKIIKDNLLKFPETIKLAEDTCFNISYLQSCKTISFIDEDGYFYRMNNISTKYKFNFDEYCTHVDVFQKYCDSFFKKTGYAFKTINNLILLTFLLTLNRDVAVTTSYKDFKYISKEIISNSMLPLNRDIIHKKRDLLLCRAYGSPNWGYFFVKIDNYIYSVYMFVKIDIYLKFLKKANRQR